MAQETKHKVVIGMPLSDSAAMKARTAHSVAANIIKSDGAVMDFIIEVSCDIVNNRTQLVKHAQARKATHLLFVDYDMQFPPDTLKKLLAHDKDIVGASYHKREFPLKALHVPLTSESGTELFKCKGMPLGLMLIKLSVFDELKDEIWFNFGRDAQGKTVIGEDYWFCNVARDGGFDVWCDPTIPTKHLGEFPF